MYRVVIIDLPPKINSYVVRCFDEGEHYYTIFINDKLSPADRLNAFQHELSHIDNGDFDKEFTDVSDIETERHNLEKTG